MLTDRGTEYCGNPEHHEYELYLALEDIDHSRTKTKSPQTDSIVERFHKTVLDEFYRIAFRKKIYGSIADLQVDLDRLGPKYNEERPHQGRWCFGKTPMQTFLDATPLAKENDRCLIIPDGGTDLSPDADRQIKCQLLHRHARPNATAPRLDSTRFETSLKRLKCARSGHSGSAMSPPDICQRACRV